MEDSSNQTLAHKLDKTLSHLRLKSQKLDQVSAHCKQDHMVGFNLDDRKNRSCYRANFSPPKLYPDYNQSIPQKELQIFRKNETNSLLLPSILSSSNYQTAFKERGQEKIVRSKQKQSWFLKGEWCANPSQSQSKFNGKNGNQFNKTNHLRSNYSTLAIFKLQQPNKGLSSYHKDFKPHLVKKEAKLSIGGKDHLSTKENKLVETGLSEYQRRFDSLAEFDHQKYQTVSYSPFNKLIHRTPL